MRQRVIVGGTFALDQTLERPLLLLLEKAVEGVQVEIEWLPYAILSNDSWTAHIGNSTKEDTYMIFLLVRLNDLDVFHPEMVHKEPEKEVHKQDLSSLQLQFLKQLQQVIKASNGSTTKYSIVLCICPPPTNQIELYKQKEEVFVRKIERFGGNRLLILRPSVLLELLKPSLEYYHAKNDQLAHAPYTNAFLNVLALEMSRQICRLYRSTVSKKKVIVLDCDNTLWGGAAAELGPHGVLLSPNFLALQQFVVQQQRQGLLICLASKNIEKDVLQVFEQLQEEMILKLKEHVVLYKINWELKSKNIQAIAKELSLGLDSFVFIDDNAIECHEVKSKLPQIEVIHLPKDFDPFFLKRQWIFDPPFDHLTSNTSEDSSRTALYQQKLARDRFLEEERQQNQGSNKKKKSETAFFASLGVKIQFEQVAMDHSQGVEEKLLQRILQLHQRTNQFNVATTFGRKLSRQVLLEEYVLTDDMVQCAHVTDRFGHYGLVGVILCKVSTCTQNVLQVNSFLLSCRALNRGVEHDMLKKIGKIAVKNQLSTIEITWEPTERNEPARAFFASLKRMVFITPNHQIIDTRQEKLRSSANTKGVWRIQTELVHELSFLKKSQEKEEEEEDESEQLGATKDRSLRRILGSLSRWNILTWCQWLYRWTRKSVLVFLYHCIIKCLPSSLKRWLMAKKTNLVAGVTHLTGIPIVPLSTYEDLESFLNLHGYSSEQQVGETELLNLEGDTNEDPIDDINEIGKFRRKARYQAKLSLQNHLADENADVIWSANGPKQQTTVEDAEEAPIAIKTTLFQRKCKTNNCTFTLALDSKCTFERCRNCCYRIQRLLVRVHENWHEMARQTALQALEEEFGIVSSNMENIHNCVVHRNPRRVK